MKAIAHSNLKSEVALGTPASAGRTSVFGFNAVLLSAVAACLIGGSPARAAAAQPPVRVLLFSGQNNHDWRQTTPRIKAILTASGRFTVNVTERPDQCNAATFARYEVIVSDWNTFPADAKIKEWPASMREAFLKFIRAGGGHVVVHSGSSSFENWTEYRQLSGSAWGKGTGHGPVHTFEVRLVEDHPITQGLEPFRITDELWHRAEVQPRTVLATAFSSKDQGGSSQDEPVAMVTEFGKGRGFTLLLGHDIKAMEAPGFQALLLRGTEWAATGQVAFRGSYPESVIDTALKAAATYHFGDSRQALATVEALVRSASSDPAAKQRLATKLVALLASDATAEAKQFACWQLSLIGSALEVPPLARLLPDTNLTYYARLALERIPGDESLAALQAALTGASGSLRLDLINSLAVRGSEKVVPDLARLINAPDAATASAAIQALGNLRGPSAATALLAAEGNVSAALKPQWAEALLQCAQRLLAAGNTQTVLPILEKLAAQGTMPHIRLAAFPLQVSAMGDQGSALLMSALGGEDKLMQAAAIRALRTTRNAALLNAAADRLDTLALDLQVPVIALLGERGDAVALPAVTKAVASKDASVKRAAIVALGSLGNATTVPVLAGIIEAADSEEKKLIAEALTRLRGAGVDDALVAALRKSSPTTQRGLIRALTAREVKTGIPALIEVASSPDAQVRREALAGLEKIGDTSATVPLVRMLDNSSDTEAIEAALVEICRRETNVEAVVRALPNAVAGKKILLLGVLGAVGGPDALEAVRSATKAEDAETRAAAVRALAAWPDAAPLEELASIGSATSDAKLKALAMRGVARLAPLAKDRSADQLVACLSRAMSGAATAEQKALLGALGEVPSLPAMKAAAAQLAQPELADEAGLAVLKIVEAVGPAHRADARAALEQVRAACRNPAVTERAETMSLRYGDLQNLSLGATATSPDDLDKDGAAGGDQAAIDGKPDTYWDEADNQRLYRLRVQLQQPSRVVFLRLLGWQQHNYAPKNFEVLCDDKVVKQVANATYKNNWLEVNLPPTDCAAVELKITGYYGASPAIRELEIYGKPAGR
jgi:hypothetical protein